MNAMDSSKFDPIQLARQSFAETYDEIEHSNMATIIAQSVDCWIIRLCYDHQKPPARAFYSVDRLGNVQELTFADVVQYGEKPWA